MIRKHLAVNMMFLTMSTTALSWAGGHAQPEVMVRLVEAHAVPLSLMIQAKKSAAQILASAGVSLRWANGTKKAETSDCREGAPVRTIDLRFSSSTPETDAPGGLAVAFPYAHSGVRIVVFLDRLANTFRLRPTLAGVILGHVLAHEICHVLLGISNHAPTGLMKPFWSGADFSQMGLKKMEVTNSDTEFILSNLASACSVMADNRPAGE
jgi:hypothetical protein